MKKYLLAAAVSIFALAGSAGATLILETPPQEESLCTVDASLCPTAPVMPTVKKSSTRPSLTKTLDKRPSLPKRKFAGNPNVSGNVQPALGTGKKLDTIGTGKTLDEAGTGKNAGVKSPVKTIVRQNAEDVKAYREERGYIIRHLTTITNRDEKKVMSSNIESAIKTLLATQKTMRKTYDDAAEASSGTLMTEATWDSLADNAVDTYRLAVLPYVDTAKMDNFERFIIGRRNLLKGIFDKLEIIRLVKTK